jgi:hypothetical protein
MFGEGSIYGNNPKPITLFTGKFEAEIQTSKQSMARKAIKLKLHGYLRNANATFIVYYILKTKSTL